MKKAVVFGGAGFLGSHVADELTNRGYSVVIYDLNQSPYLKPNQQMVVGDIGDKQAVSAAVMGAEYVYNFAGLADINEAKNNPERTAQLNIMGNLTVLEAARTAGVKRFVYASTVYVFSESGSFYRVTKQTSEKFIELYQEKYGLPFTILRYGSLYGRRADQRNAIYGFIYDALVKGRVEYRGSGEELREYIHVADAAVASVDVLTPEFANQHLVITGHQVYRVRDVMLMISEILQNKAVLEFKNLHIEAHYTVTPYAYKPRLGKKLVVNPFVDMGQGVLDCIHEISDELHKKGVL